MHCTFDLALFAGTFQLFIPRGMDFLVTGCHPVHGGNVSNGGVKADMVVVVDELSDDAFCILQGERRFRANGLFLECALEALQFSVGLRVVGRTEHVGGLPVADELLEVFGHEL